MKHFSGTLSLSPPFPKIRQPNPKGFQGPCPATSENTADVGLFHNIERRQISTKSCRASGLGFEGATDHETATRATTEEISQNPAADLYERQPSHSRSGNLTHPFSSTGALGQKILNPVPQTPKHRNLNPEES